jgi:hypothetical protein
MSPGQYRASYDEAVNLIRMVGLDKNIQNGNKPTSNKFDTTRKEKDYLAVYEAAINNNDFNMLLKDDSLLQFKYFNSSEGLEISYSYYEFPLDFPSYDLYLENQGLCYDIVGEEYRSIYEYELQSAPVKRTPTPIRYDYDLLRYKAGVHAVSHIHIGHSNNVRIPSNIIISPKLFIFFILKHAYYSLWKKLIEQETVLTVYRKARQSCSYLGPGMFCELDQLELFLA